MESMQADYARMGPYVIAAVAVLLIYRRFRRSFGAQPLRPVRMRVRIGIFCLLAASMVPVAIKSGQFLLAETTGLVAGITVGAWGAQRTRYRSVAGRLYYVPHTYTGIAVSLLFIGRLVYRFVQVYSQERADAPMGATNPMFAQPSVVSSPLTVGLLFVLVGYYVSYYGLVLWKHKRISPEELEVSSTPPATSP